MRTLVLAVLLLFPTPVLGQMSSVQGTGTLTEQSDDLPGFSTGLLSYTIVVPTSPADAYEAGLGYEVDNILARFFQGSTELEVTGFFSWFSLDDGGGFEFWANDFLLGVFADQIFTGPIDAPTFVNGTYPVEQNIGLIETSQFTITTVIPEPHTIVLLAVGMLVLGIAQKARNGTEHGSR